jgi:uncharacterized protein (TIGR02217 family)
MGFHEVRFPTTIAYGTTGGPGFSTYITTVDSGQEERISRRGSARCIYDVASGIKKQEDLHILISFFRARMGSTYGFRFKDWSDYATSASGTTYDGDVTSHSDMQIGVGDGTTTQFQLYKIYTSGDVTRSRKIVKPVAGTVKVGFDGVNQAAGWTVDTATGIVTFTVAPTAGVVITVGFEFDVPVRFGEEIDRHFPVRLEEYRNGSIQIPLIELLDEGVSADEFYYGGAEEVASAADVIINFTARVWVINMTAAGKKVITPGVAEMPTGGPLWYVFNGGANSFNLVDASLNVLATVGVGDCATLVISRDSLGSRVWYAF